MAIARHIDIDAIRDVLSYEPASGKLIWKQTRGLGQAGQEAGTRQIDGYIRVILFRRSYKAHRLVWALYYGEQPPQCIDHINGNPSDNRIENLRKCEQRDNSRNQKLNRSNASGYKGVCRSVVKSKKPFRAYIAPNRKHIHLGTFDTEKEAAIAYNIAARHFFGEFASINKISTDP